MWSVGVIIYCLLSGQVPFNGKKNVDLFKNVIEGRYSFDDDWATISADAKDLIKNLLVTDAKKRYTAKDALKSKWINKRNARELKKSDLSRSQGKLQTFDVQMKLKATILAT